MKKIIFSIALCVSTGLCADFKTLNDQLCESPQSLVERTLQELKDIPHFEGAGKRIQEKDAREVFAQSKSVGEFRAKVFATNVIPFTFGEACKAVLSIAGLPVLVAYLLKRESASEEAQAVGFFGGFFAGAGAAYLLIKEGYYERQRQFITNALNCSECLREALEAKVPLLSSSENHVHAQFKIQAFKGARKLCCNHKKADSESSEK